MARRFLWLASVGLAMAAVAPGAAAGTKKADHRFGTAFVVSQDGYLASSAHGNVEAWVAGRPISVYVGGRAYKAKLVTWDEKRDLALLKIKATGLKPLPLADSDAIERGQELRVVGFPEPTELGTELKVTRGVYSGPKTRLHPKTRKKLTRFYTDAKTNPGNSGGPWVNLRGEAIAVHIAGTTTGKQMGVAVPVNDLKPMLRKHKVAFIEAAGGPLLDGAALMKAVAPSVGIVVTRYEDLDPWAAAADLAKATARKTRPGGPAPTPKAAPSDDPTYGYTKGNPIDAVAIIKGGGAAPEGIVSFLMHLDVKELAKKLRDARGRPFCGSVVAPAGKTPDGRLLLTCRLTSEDGKTHTLYFASKTCASEAQAKQVEAARKPPKGMSLATEPRERRPGAEDLGKSRASDDPTYGYKKENPIKLGVGGEEAKRLILKRNPAMNVHALGEAGLLAFGGIAASEEYLKLLRDAKGRPYTFGRKGQAGLHTDGHVIDEYELTDPDGNKLTLYLDTYHPEAGWRGVKVPKGMSARGAAAEPAERPTAVDPRYGYFKTSPIKLGPDDKAAEQFCRHLRDAKGRPLKFRKLDETGKAPDGHSLVAYRLEDEEETEYILYFDPHHPEAGWAHVQPPSGLSLKKPAGTPVHTTPRKPPAETPRTRVEKPAETEKPDPEYGYRASLPIQLGPGKAAIEDFCRHLRDEARRPLTFRRRGEAGKAPDGHTVVAYDLRGRDGVQYVLFFDAHHPEVPWKDAKAPAGLRLATPEHRPPASRTPEATQAAKRRDDAAKALGVPAELTLSLGTGLAMKLALIPAGKFTIGAPEGEAGRFADEAAHDVTLTRPFYLGVHEVTRTQWMAVMGTGHVMRLDNQPVHPISWNEAVAFCRKLAEKTGRAVRLPAEAEWEYACRAGSSTAFCFGDNWKPALSQYAWFQLNAAGRAHPVGKTQPNAWGLFDMHGNAFEWCSDWYGPYPAAAVTDPTGPATGTVRVVRGGDAGAPPRLCRSAKRFYGAPTRRVRGVGLRVVVDIPRRAAPRPPG